MNLHSKVAVVTGANSGIGRAIATALAKEGTSVVIAGRRQLKNEEVADALARAYGGKTLPLQADVSRESDCQTLFQKTLAAFGKLDILVNNAGIGGGQELHSTTTADFDRVLKTNLYGTFWCAREAFRAMRGNQVDQDLRGAIINISSLAGKQAWAGTGAYSASKFAVLGLTEALADEGRGEKIKACAICPAMVATPMTKVSGPEFIQPEDIAETVLFLLRLSPAAWPTEIVLPRRDAS